MRKFRALERLLLAAVLLSGCQKGHPEGSAIALDAKAEWAGLTKATLLRGPSLATVEIGTSAFLYDGEWTEAMTPNYFYNVPFRFMGSYWVSEAQYYWPGSSRKLRFFCYAPFGAAVLSDSREPGAPVMQFTVADSADAQVDLLVADTGTLDGGERQALTVDFSHALCAVRFAIKAGSRSGLLRGLEIGGLYNAASRSLAWGSSWTSYAGDASYALEGSFPYTSSSEGLNLYDGDKGLLLLLPQSRSDAWIRALYEVQGEDDVREIQAGPFTVNWEQGKIYTYTLDVRESVTVSVSVAGLAEVGPDTLFEVGVYPFAPAESAGGDYTGGNGDFVVTRK